MLFSSILCVFLLFLEWIDIFNELDANNDGELCRDEIVYAMRVLGTNPTDVEVDDYIKEADKNSIILVHINANLALNVIKDQVIKHDILLVF